MLCPNNRKLEANEKIEGLDNSAVITWEDVLDRLRSVQNISNPTARIVRNEFSEYLKRHFNFIHDFERKSIHLKSAFPEYGSPMQRELVTKLWSLFPSAGARISIGKKWIGYYFYTDPNINQKGWFGFVPIDVIESPSENRAELIIATTYNAQFSDGLKKIELVNEHFIGAPGNTHAWVIDFKEDWNNIDQWRQILSPLWEAVKVETT